VEEHELWQKDDMVIRRITGFRFGTWTVETNDNEPPVLHQKSARHASRPIPAPFLAGKLPEKGERQKRSMDQTLCAPRQDLRTPEKAIAGASSRFSEELLCRPADENLCCAICTGLFVRPTRTACGYSFATHALLLLRTRPEARAASQPECGLLTPCC
jgi:hypothetical protein